MTCQLCKQNEGIYDYQLVDGSQIAICKKCGEILYEKDIRHTIYRNMAGFQKIALMNYVLNFYDESIPEEFKTLNRETIKEMKNPKIYSDEKPLIKTYKKVG